jgi:hypothetical protein
MSRCPSCNRKISYFKIKREFNCPYCKQQLSANLTFALLVPFVLWAVFVPLIASRIANTTICGDGFLCSYGVDLAIGLPIFILLFPLLLKLKQARLG